MAAASRARSLERENASAARQPQPAALFEAVESTLFVEAQRNVLLCLPTKSGATLLRRLLPEFGWSLKRAPPVTIAAHASYLKVAIVREPLSRLAAAFAYKAPKVAAASRERGDLVRFLSTTRWQQLSQDPRRMDRHFQPQVLACRPDLLVYDVVLRFERLEADVRALLERLGAGPGATARLHALFERVAACSDDSSCVPREKPATDALPERTRRALLQLYGGDLEWWRSSGAGGEGAAAASAHLQPAHGRRGEEAVVRVRERGRDWRLGGGSKKVV